MALGLPRLARGFFIMNNIKEIAKNKILILDGAMGTMVQSYGLSEEDLSWFNI